MGDIILLIVLLHLLCSYLRSRLKSQKNKEIKEVRDNAIKISKALETTVWLQDYIVRQIVVIAILFYAFCPEYTIWLKIYLPSWIGLSGLVLMVSSPLLKMWSYKKLGRNWSTKVVINQRHSLITTGPYHWIRHPIYLSYLMLALGIFFATGSLTLFSLGACFFIIDLIRGFEEEKALRQKFVAEYPQYAESTGGYVPLFVTYSFMALSVLGAIVGAVDQTYFMVTGNSFTIGPICWLLVLAMA